MILAVWIILPPQYLFHANWPYSVRLFWCRRKQWHRDILFVLCKNFCHIFAFGRFWALGFFHNTVSYGHRMTFLNDHQGCRIFHTHLLALSCNGCALLFCSIMMSFCPSLPFVLILSTLDSYILPTMLVNINIFSILLVNVLNSDEMFASSHPRSTLLPWVQSQHCSCSFLSPPLSLLFFTVWSTWQESFSEAAQMGSVYKVAFHFLCNIILNRIKYF